LRNLRTPILVLFSALFVALVIFGMQLQAPTALAYPGGAGNFSSSMPTANVCAGCHNVTMGGAGSTSISGLPSSYTAGGPAIPLTVTVTDSKYSTFGFQLTAALASNLGSAGGTFTAGSNTNISGTAVEGSDSANTFTFNWMPPAAASSGAVNFYLSGIGTSSTGNNDGYTAMYSVPAAAAATPNFSLSANPTSVSVAQGASGTSTITVAPSNGFTGTVAYTASGMPTGVTTSFTGNTLTLTASSTATIGGPTTVTITGTSGALSHTTTVGVTVTAAVVPPNFTLSANPASVSVTQGASGTSTMTIMPSNGFSGTVAYAASGLPSGVTSSYSGNTMTFMASSTAAVGGPTTVTITGTSGTLSHSTTVGLTVSAGTQPANFSLSANPSSITIAPGSSGTSTITINPSGGFSASSVKFSPLGMPTGLTGTFGAISSSGTSTLTISAGSSAAAMTIGVTVTGTSGSLSHTAMLNVTVGSSSGSGGFTVNPSSLTFRSSGGSMPSSQGLKVSDSAGAEAYSASVTGGTWLTASPSTGNTPGTVMVGANPSRMSAGTYTGTVHLTYSGGTAVSVPVTLVVASSSCSDDCGGGGTTGTLYAQPYAYDPNSTGTVSSAWVNGVGQWTNNYATTHDPGLVLSKDASAPSGSYAGAIIKGASGPLTELGFDYREGGQCTATSPRFIVVTTDNVTHVVGGCSKGTSTAAPTVGWKRVRFNLADTSQTSPAIVPGEQVSSITLVLDYGPEAGSTAAGGLVVIDNIDVNGTFAASGVRSYYDN
jgi:hypothetical protein